MFNPFRLTELFTNSDVFYGPWKASLELPAGVTPETVASLLYRVPKPAEVARVHRHFERALDVPLVRRGE